MTSLSTPTIVHHKAALDGNIALPNSLEAIQACLEANVTVIEIDVNALADSDYLLTHDSTLDSETTGHGDVSACSAADARNLRYRIENGETNTPVPLLSDVVRLFAEYPNNTQLQIDFKNVFPFMTEEPIQRLVNIMKPLEQRVIVSSLGAWQLRKLRKYDSQLRLGLDIHLEIDLRTKDYEPPAGFPPPPYRQGAYGYWDDHPLSLQAIWSTAEYLEDRCVTLAGIVPNISVIYCRHTFLNKALDDGFNWMERLHNMGILCCAYTVDIDDTQAVENAKRLVNAGVDQITTNTPQSIRQLFVDGNK
jgi:glycerophosphoryl diester phosphodiesterase